MPYAPLSDLDADRECPRCGVVAPVGLGFYLRSNGALAHPWCKACEVARVKVAQPPKGTRRPGVLVEVDGVLSQQCRTCEGVKPVEQFTKHSTATTGYMTSCNACRAAKGTASYRRSPRHCRAVLARMERALDAPSRVRRQRVKSGRRRALLAGAPIVDLTRGEWAAIIDEFGGFCAYCGTDDAGTRSGRMSQDHVVPLSRGGSHTVGNVVPACRPCNSSKRDRTAAEFLGVADGVSTMMTGGR